MKHHFTLPIVLTLLGIITQMPAHAAGNLANEAKQNSQPDVILQEQGALDQTSPVLESDGSRYQSYSFQGTAGQTVEITLESSSFDAYVILLDEDNQKLAENDDREEGSTDSLITFDLPYTGRYQVIVNTYRPGEQGDFRLVVQVGRSADTTSQSPDCPEDSYYPGNYAQVSTQDGSPLRVRATPNGRVIGAIPSGWQVIVQQTDASGNWTKVGSHFGAESDSYEVGFGSAPDFRAGWVSTAYLRSLGFSCDKPANLQSLMQPDLFGQREVTVNEDWVARGDRLAKVARSSNR